MADPFSNSADAVSAPARNAVAVTPSDTVPLSDCPKALYIGIGGSIVMRGIDGSSDQTWANVPSGAILPFRAQYVRATGTSAAGLLALY